MSENSVQKCRVCLKNITKSFAITKHAIGCNPKITYGQILKDYAKLKCSSSYERYMPQYLCILCCRQLRNAYNFIQQAQYCNNKLVNIISKQLASLKGKAIVCPENKQMEKTLSETLMNEFRIVNTSLLLKSEILEEASENEEPIQCYVEDNDEIKFNDHDQNKPEFNHNIQASSDSQIVNMCPICKKLIGKHDNIITHIRVQHGVKAPSKFLNMHKQAQQKQIFACKNIDKHQYNLKEKSKSENKIIKCRSCDYTARTYASLNFHKRSKHGTEEDKFKCIFCPYTSLKKSNLLTHVQNAHKELIKTLKIDMENKMNERKSSNEASNTQTNFLSTPEFVTTQEVKTSLTINEDSSNAIMQKLIKCDSKPEELDDEMFIRNILDIKKRQPGLFAPKSLPRRCDECGNIYKNYQSLKIHQKNVHISEEKYCLCPHCGKKLKRKSNLRKHIKMVHNSKNSTNIVKKPAAHKEKRFMCSECSYVCSTISILKIHISRHHTGEKPYKCDICQQSYLLKFDLKIHRYLHTGERPYKCPFCSKRFRCTSKLIRHKRIHNNERPFKCMDCDKTFTQSYNLTMHKRSHLKEKKLNCTICDKFFENQALLNLHCINENHYNEVV